MAEQDVAADARLFNSPLMRKPLTDEEVAEAAAEIVAVIGMKEPPRSPIHHNRYQLGILRCSLAIEFGRRRGWTWHPDSYGAQHLLGKRPQYHQRDLPPYHDHMSGYRIGRMPVAIVSQPYDASATHRLDMQIWATDRSLLAYFPSFPSWWYPGRTTLCVFTRKPQG